jgi:hypothetical protein
MEEVFHDPFARESISREAVAPKADGCDWCGGFNILKGSKHLFAYSIQKDDKPRRYNRIKGTFCSISCLKDYYL